MTGPAASCFTRQFGETTHLPFSEQRETIQNQAKLETVTEENENHFYVIGWLSHEKNLI